MLDWEQLFNQEIERAKQARRRGKEGMARVCARRAANIVIQEYFRILGIQPYRNAIQNFRWLQSYLRTDHPAQESIRHLLLKVNEDFTFPEQIDLIKEAHNLRDLLLFNR